MIDLNKLSKDNLSVSETRVKNGDFGKRQNSVTELLKYCAGEVVEAMEAYNSFSKSEFTSELADVITCILIIAAKENINIEVALKDCNKKNKKRIDKNDESR